MEARAPLRRGWDSGGAFWLPGGAGGQEGGEGVEGHGVVGRRQRLRRAAGANRSFVNDCGGGEGAAAGDARGLGGAGGQEGGDEGAGKGTGDGAGEGAGEGVD